MNHDQNKKTLRQFQCRDYLWEIFEQMSAELECSVDYLVNEAMRQYARSRNYGVRTPGPGMGPAPTPGAIPSRSGGQPSIPSAPPPPPPTGGAGYGGGYGGGGGGYPAPPGSAPGYGAAQPAYPPPQRPSSYPPPPTQRPPAYGNAPQPQMPPPPSYPQGFGGPAQQSHPGHPGQSHPGQSHPGHAPPPLPGAGPGAGPAPGGMSPLYVIFNGQKFPVQKEEFILGRGTKTADLPIKDGNISRRHAAVIWQNGGWYMKDLGSTNGVEFHGRKIDSKRIEEGDVYQLCDYEVRFTYR
ncbi:MAG: FHA domain-containing protein [Sandaracinaceae bacterium]|nr:MAG: FHA domain-containing protein [Sandaracinaceae bacterium]